MATCFGNPADERLREMSACAKTNRSDERLREDQQIG